MLVHPPDLALTTFLTPDDDPLPELLALLRGALASVRVIAYGFTLPSVVDELIAAHRRGVRVRLILDSSQAAGRAERVQVDRLRQARVPLVTGRSSKGGIIHLKMAIVDAHYMWTGSWNWSASASLQINDCYLLALPGQMAASKRIALFEREWKRLRRRSGGAAHGPAR